MEIWGFMPPGYEGETGGKCVPKNSRHEFFTPPDVVFFCQILQHIREGNSIILKITRKKLTSRRVKRAQIQPVMRVSICPRVTRARVESTKVTRERRASAPRGRHCRLPLDHRWTDMYLPYQIYSANKDEQKRARMNRREAPWTLDN